MFEIGDEIKYIGDEERFEGITGEVSAVETFDDGTQVLRVESESAPHGFVVMGSREVEHLTRHTGGDPVNHPAHYTWLPGGVEVIDITEQFSFTLGNALKYIMRADQKGKPIEDLQKARWYLNREIERRENA